MQVLQNFFGRSKDNEDLRYKISDFDLQLDDLKDFMDNFFEQMKLKEMPLDEKVSEALRRERVMNLESSVMRHLSE